MIATTLKGGVSRFTEIGGGSDAAGRKNIRAASNPHSVA
jgi:hypothetical protein